MKKSELPNYFWLARMPGLKMGRSSFWRLGPTFEIPESKLSEFEYSFSVIRVYLFTIPSVFLWFWLSIKLDVGEIVFLSIFLIMAFGLPEVFSFLALARFRQVSSEGSLELTFWESLRVKLIYSRTPYHSMELLCAAIAGLNLWVNLLREDVHYPSVYVMFFVVCIFYAAVGFVPLSKSTVKKLKQMIIVNRKRAEKNPEFRVLCK